MPQLNMDSLYQVMRDFYLLTKIRIVLFNADFRKLLAYPQEREPFCELIRHSPDGAAKCMASDKSGCLRCSECNGLVTYRCHAGLTEVVAPVSDSSGVLAYVMLGQIILEDDSVPAKKRLRKMYPQYAEQIEQIPVKTQQELNAVTTVLQAITAVIMTNRWVAPDKPEFIRQIDSYIENHLAQNITVEDICSLFRMGRTKLYESADDYLGCGLAEYIRRQKIRHAQRLLVESNLTVTEIAYCVGFSDYNHFSRVFKTVTGMSARAYRYKQKDSG